VPTLHTGTRSTEDTALRRTPLGSAPPPAELMEGDAIDAAQSNFGQKIDLCTRLRDILAAYPDGSSVLKELLQNADDAGASQVTPAWEPAYIRLLVSRGGAPPLTALSSTRHCSV
jgi:hypothetical protein